MFKYALYALTAITLSFPAFAVDSLDEAKTQGLVGETPKGYLSPVSNAPTPDVRLLINDINAKRRAEYGKIAAARSQTLSVVEQLAGKKLTERTPAGQYVQNDAGQWVKK